MLEYILRSSAFPAIVHRLERSELIGDDMTGRLENWWAGVKMESSSRIRSCSIDLARRMERELRIHESSLAERLERLSGRDPAIRTAKARETARRLGNILQMGMESGLKLKASELTERTRTLSGLHPLEVLGRGYTYCTSPGGDKFIGRSDDIVKGDEMMVHFYDGGALCTVEEKRGGDQWRKK